MEGITKAYSVYLFNGTRNLTECHFKTVREHILFWRDSTLSASQMVPEEARVRSLWFSSDE
jgi:hypothetical protein